MRPILLTLVLAVVGAVGAQHVTGVVISILDGDTVEIVADNRLERVRLRGIDAPEGRQAFSGRSREYTSELCLRRVVVLKDTTRDIYGRLVADVILPDGRNLSEEIVRAGYAWHYIQYSRDTTLARLEREARENRRGLWADTYPVPPWVFRQGSQEEHQPAREADSVGAQTVYRTRTGNKYHRLGCSYLRSSAIPTTLRDAVAAGLTPCSRCSPPTIEGRGSRPQTSPTAGAITVYVTRTGAKYHRAGCSYLRRSSIPMTLEEARAAGYTPCSRCGPPR